MNFIKLLYAGIQNKYNASVRSTASGTGGDTGNYHGNHSDTNTSNQYRDQNLAYHCMIMDRILDAENQIYVGIGTHILSNKSDGTPVSGSDTIIKDSVVKPSMELQVIRIGNYTKKYHRLLGYTETPNKLKYEFENDVKLILVKHDDHQINMEVFDLNNDVYISKWIEPCIVKYFKPLGFSSNELDKIGELFASSSSQPDEASNK